ncbi:MAG: hypothetical protein EZS28_006335 [Streblomastix strix]|uniref:Uncharacterized protein n=1 Tax=Streblomastix strix TaxID=222440 RepID=A0A5J4WT62_9EUKA|nr:MAG: hypothetical protein EZS28_006335 [Streblomastix strix]
MASPSSLETSKQKLPSQPPPIPPISLLPCSPLLSFAYRRVTQLYRLFGYDDKSSDSCKRYGKTMARTFHE